MTFRDLKLKETYDSDDDDILQGFYIPVLSNAVSYDRLAGFFSSTAFAASARGMSEFIRNGGKMRLITCMQVPKHDLEALKNVVEDPDSVITKMMMVELDTVDGLLKNHVDALAWMVVSKKLEIKIAIPLKDDGNYLSEALDPNSLYHQKIGILHDTEDNIITFSGSINETSKAWLSHIEEFKVFRSWERGQDSYAASDSKKFEKFWYGDAKNTRIFDLPRAMEENLMKMAPDSKDDAMAGLEGKPTQPRLRPYQEDAVQKWIGNGRRGIFEMATGTGKTITAISCIKNIQDLEPCVTVITCPYRHLITQWISQLEQMGIKAKRADGSSALWLEDLKNLVHHLNSGIIDNLTIVTTHSTFSKEKFMDMMGLCKTKSFLVGDEVHKVGSEKRACGLLDSYDYRLGLSATPQRYFDDPGTDEIFNFFGPVVFEFDLDNAIREGHLTHYELYPHVVYMTASEEDEYHKLTRQIAMESSKEDPDYLLLERLSIKRSDIIKNAENKIPKLKEIVEKESPLDHCLIYCNQTSQLEDVAKILHFHEASFHRFTNSESMDERDALLREFDNGDKDFLLAIKCLDEGVDVPSTKTAIIMASSHNPVEFIQRRGRILRPHEGKKIGIIHDMIVLPKRLPDGGVRKYEKRVLRKELDRVEEFARSADNPEHGREIITTLMKRYGA